MAKGSGSVAVERVGRKAGSGAAHQTRDTETRDAAPVHDEEDTPWLRGASLAMPPARPGMDQRWIRTELAGKFDATNWARKQREGWKPRRAETVSEDFPVPRIDDGKFSGLIGIEGNILCERPLAISRRRDRHFAKETERRTEAINADLDRLNRDNRNPAFGPVRMATRSVPAREVPLKDD